MNYDSYLLERRTEIQKKLKEINTFLAKAPEGNLHICKNKGKSYYYVYIPSPGDSKIFRKYIRKKDIKKLKLFGKKRCYLEWKKKLENELEAIDAYFSIRQKYINTDDINTTVNLVFSNEDHFSDFVQDWLNEPFVPNPNHREYLKVPTNDGIYVRSKSEAMIYNRLKEAGLAVIYEKPLALGNITIYPDFTIMNPKTNKIYILEHFGKMDDFYYVKKFCFKIDLYNSNNYVNGNNFFMTMETGSIPFDIRSLDPIINFIETDTVVIE